MNRLRKEKPQSNWKLQIHEIIYEADTKTGKLFDIVLLILIVASIVLVMLESVKSFDQKYHSYLLTAEWIITILFTIEYILRIISVKRPSKYIFSMYGIIDFLSTIPLYISLFVAGSQVLIAVRALRLLRVFRILKLVHYMGEGNQLLTAIKASRTKISVFLFAMVVVSIMLGTVMYIVESDESGFTSIPRSVYWCIVTLTTVGYGDIAPITPFGQFLAAVIMILGYGIIAVPTGIVSAEYATSLRKTATNTQSCHNCLANDHRDGAAHCYRCGELLEFDKKG